MNASQTGMFLICRPLYIIVEINTKKYFIFLVCAHGVCREDVQDKQLICKTICALPFFL